MDNKLQHISSERMSGKDVVLAYLKQHPEVPVDFTNRFLDAYQESKKLDQEIKILEMKNDLEIFKISKKYESYRMCLECIFGERFKGLDAHYKVLDKALAENDRELIISSLKGISSIVSTNPLESFVDFVRILEDDNETLKLDF